MTEHAPEPGLLSPAEILFVQWLRRGATASSDFETLLPAHPEHEAELRRLWAALTQALAGSETRPLAEKLQERYGFDADQNVALTGGEKSEAERSESAPTSSQLLQRLAEHRLKSPRYTLRGELARGGMGAILRVFDQDLQRTLAMKVILGQVPANSTGATPPVDKRLLARFLEEAQVTGQLDHPGIVPVHELGLDAEGRVFFTMKLVKGRDLKAIFNLVFEQQEDWSETRALSVLLKMCEAVAFAHKKGVIHRDLKPANVMIGSFGEVYVMDWGLARVIGREDKHDLRLRAEAASSSLQTERRAERVEAPDSPLITMDGDVVGTPSYMPPEQARGEVERLGPHSDVYAIGAMLYHLLTRQMPYVPPGARLSNRTVLAQVLHGPPTPIHSIRKDVPAELEAICDKAMAREPDARYADTLALAEDLRAYLEGRVVRAYRTGALVELKKWVQRNRGFAGSLAAAVVLLVAGVLGTSTFAVRAGHLKDEAVVREDTANARADALWAIEELKNFNALDDDLEYARSQDRPTSVWWLERAHELVDGRPADPARGLRKKPGLADHQRLLAEIRRSGRAPTEAELASDRASHPLAKELETKRAELTWTARMLGLESWPSEAEVEAALEKEELPSDAGTLNNMAWKIADPDARVVGQEVRALVLARRAVAGAGDDQRAMFRDTLAWTFLWTGKFDKALAEERHVMEAAAPEKHAEYAGYLRRIESLAQPFRDGTASTQRASLTAEVEALEREVAGQRTFRFGDREMEWWNTHLAQLEQDLQDLAKRIAVGERSVASPKAAQAWNTAIEAIAASPAYAGLHLTPQLELLPIGPDPDSGLWEFAHLGTGEPAARGAGGRLVLLPETGIVFVLLPSGRVPVEDGKQPTMLNHVLLDPFFLSKYEMTVAQWRRTSRWSGKFWKDEPLFPANNVSWDDCVPALEHAGFFLRLPTEAQWEYGCRAKTTTPWWTGASKYSLRDAASISLDPKAKRGELQQIGTLRANLFGLHDVHGNEWEWCSDEYGDESVPVRPGDGEREATGSRLRVIRGGGFNYEVGASRSGQRYPLGSGNRFPDYGLRVARRVTP